MKIDGEWSSERWLSTRCFMKIQHGNTITRRHLQNLASTSVKHTLFADRHSILGKSTRTHAIAGTLRNRTLWKMRCSVIDVSDLTPNSSSGKLQRSKMPQINNATLSRVDRHESKYWIRRNPEIICVTKSSYVTLQWLPCDVHHCSGSGRCS